MAGCDNFGERLGSELAQRHQARFHHARHQRRHQARVRNDALQMIARAEPKRNVTQLDGAFAKQLGGCQLGHRTHARDRIHLARLGADQDGRFAAHAEVRKLGHRGREHGRDARIDGRAALIVEAHAGVGGPVAAGRDRSVGAANRLAQGRIRAAGLGASSDDEDGGGDEERSSLHRATRPSL